MYVLITIFEKKIFQLPFDYWESTLNEEECGQSKNEQFDVFETVILL